ncbi:TM1812 family CRISPR-associated protein [Alicyclobacillus vulcanalis]|uniref:CRISPR-associated DxTHG motif protein n=1 Tax=Alicyclobacillus vulcanalis TaxID=252246 RepID=A0A1N7K683_9BACL|nr:TM1812 family CRISPR-associated protein [Alicyclobacillus vulcanalis]SIS57121.1 CRISPR-associated DxTHG motif protein [Alicyclobacillus vulcanalis]
MSTRKIFVTFFGSGGYFVANYQWKDYISSSRYFQVVALEWMQKGVMPFRPDEVWVVLTPQARKKWTIPAAVGESSPRDQIYACAETMGVTVHEVDFDEQFSEQSVWRNFETLVRELSEKAESLGPDGELRVAVDATHSFRYFPMLVLTLFHYAYVVYGVRLDLILYATADRDTQQGSVLDLTPLAQLQQWVLETQRALKGPDASGVQRLVEEIQKSVAGQDSSLNALLSPLSKFAKKWNALWEVLRITKHFAVPTAAKDAIEALDACERRFAERGADAAAFYPLLIILRQVREQIEPLCETEWVPLMLAMVRWYVDRGMLHQAYTTMRELYYTHAAETAAMDVFDHSAREELSRLAHSVSKGASDPNRDHPSLANIPQERIDAARAFLEQFSEQISNISALRNQLNHGFFQSGKPNTSEETFRTSLEEPMAQLMEYVRAREETVNEQNTQS